jgi:hypothetical protein
VTSIPTSGQGSASGPKRIIGYQSVPTDGGRPTVVGGAYNFNLSGLNFWEVRSFVLQSPTVSHVLAAHVNVENCALQAAGVNHSGAFVQVGLVSVTNCSFDGTGHTASASTGCIGGTGLRLIGCTLTNISRPVFRIGATGIAIYGNRVWNCTTPNGVVFDFQTNTVGALVANNSIDTVTAGDAIAFAGTIYQNTIINNAIVNVSGSGKAAIRCAESFGSYIGQNAFFNCTANYAGGVASRGGDVSLSALPWAGGGDFTPNELAGGGLALRAAGFKNYDIGSERVIPPTGASFWRLE